MLKLNPNFSQINFEALVKEYDHLIMRSADVDPTFGGILIVYGYTRLHCERVSKECNNPLTVPSVISIMFPSDITEIIIQYFESKFEFQLYLSRKIWTSAAHDTYGIAFRLGLKKLYPHLITNFIRLTLCRRKQPTLQQIEYFFLRYGGQYDNYNNNNDPFIWDHSFDRFVNWFIGMCHIIKDLCALYERDGDPLISLFYSRTAEECLANKPEEHLF